MRFALPLGLFNLVFVASSIAAPIDDLVIVPLNTPSNCYAGTEGDDAVMFWRENPFPDCSAFTGPSTPCLNRREFANDGPNGQAVSLSAGPYQRASLTGAGDFVTFATYGFNMCFMNSATDATEQCIGRDFLGIDPHTSSFHPDGTLVAITRLDPDDQFRPTNDIFLATPATLAPVEVYEVTDFVTLYRIDTVDFTVSGTHLIIDAQNAATGQWGIYAIPRVAQPFTVVAPTPLVPPVPGLEIRNPQLAQTSDDYIVFDARDTISNVNYVVIANIVTGDTSIVRAIPGAIAATSYPSFTGDDGAVVYSVPDAVTATTASLNIQPLAGDRFTPVGADTEYVNDAYLPVVYRRGAWSGASLGACEVPVDSDGDGVSDGQDNCSNVANADQADADGDGIGTACDADLNNDCIVNVSDLGLFRTVFFTADDEADFNGDGVVNAIDLGLFRTLFFQPPGPSGLADICD